jgi:hypothetical protein
MSWRGSDDAGEATDEDAEIPGRAAGHPPPRDGEAIHLDAPQGSPSAIDAGGFYRLLRDLEQAKLVRSRWEARGSGPARRVYELTPKGEEELAAWGAALRRQHALMSSYLRRFRGAVGRDG